MRLPGLLRNLKAEIVMFGIGFAISATVSSILLDLTNAADGLVLKSCSEMGTSWCRMTMDQDLNWLLAYFIPLCGGLALFIAISVWIARRLRSVWLKAVHAAWATVLTLFMLLQLSFVMGVGHTIRPYPVAAFSSMKELVGDRYIPVLLGTDDKEVAFLLVPKPDQPDNVSKTLLFLPRSEVKWISVPKHEPIHIMAQYRDLKRLSDTLKELKERVETVHERLQQQSPGVLKESSKQ